MKNWKKTERKKYCELWAYVGLNNKAMKRRDDSRLTDWVTAWMKSRFFRKQNKMQRKTFFCYVKHAISLEMSCPALFILTLSLRIIVEIDTDSCFGLILKQFKEFYTESNVFMPLSWRIICICTSRYPPTVSCLGNSSSCKQSFIVCFLYANAMLPFKYVQYMHCWG